MTFNEYLQDVYQRLQKECEYKGSFQDFKRDFDMTMMMDDYEDSIGLPCQMAPKDWN